MRIRKRCLPAGWYPGTERQTRADIEEMRNELPKGPAEGVSGIVPHAGWAYSGPVALEVILRLTRAVDTIVIIGGHMMPSDGIMCAFEDAYETPLGEIRADRELLDAVHACIPLLEDVYADNTVEIQLPFIRYAFPDAMALGMRASPSPDAARLGNAIAEAAEKLGRRVVVIGSTDLTHYGPNYGFVPAGEGPQAVEWVKTKNDRRFIESLLSMDAVSAIELANRERSACSAGGAVTAMEYARQTGADKGTLVRYMTSYDVSPSDSFVGYAGVIFR